MPHAPLLTTVIGSYPIPGWFEFGLDHAAQFGQRDRDEMIDDAVTVAIHDQIEAGLDVITDGEQSRADFNLSFYAFLVGVELSTSIDRRFGPPGHDQRPLHTVIGELDAPNGLGTVDEFNRLQRLAGTHEGGPQLKASVPGPYTLAGRLAPGRQYPDRHAVTEALVPIVCRELVALVDAGCRTVSVDEPSMSCYADREDQDWLVDIFNRTVEPVRGKCYLGTHLCFGNYKGRAVARRRYAPMFPKFLGLHVDQVHLEMASREFAELELVEDIARVMDISVGVVDVKSYYLEPPDEIERRVRDCLRHVPAERLSVSPDCGLSQTARWASRAKLRNMVRGAGLVRASL
ncbi:MAG TPA: cobalamin-independent methionine synthase II family protein [Candidatus Dormibacteraeota bacterium]|nr:cobalamin-independent methionine synthase II family protein [Candidatus Dormibacteraeota bacterium]